jgi:hypothetical protein
MGEILGRVMTVACSQVTVNPEADLGDERLFRIGAMVKLGSGNREVVATMNSATEAIRAEKLVKAFGSVTALAGVIMVNELLRKHFAVLGTTGSGKSCAVSLLLSAILADYPMAHTILIDPHNEYGRVFGRTAEVINIDNLQLPFWLFDFEEAVGILVRGGTAQEQEAQSLILKDAITRARRHYAGESHAATTLSVDTPTPFRVSDLIRFISEAMGRLDKPDTSMPYLRLKTRLYCEMTGGFRSCSPIGWLARTRFLKSSVVYCGSR